MDPKKAKLKVREFKYKNKMLKGVVMVNPDDEGIYDIINSESLAAETLFRARVGRSHWVFPSTLL